MNFLYFSNKLCKTRKAQTVTQTIAIIEQLDKEINTLSMCLKEWFSWHFPEFTKIVNDNAIFAKLTDFIENRDGVTEENKDAIAATYKPGESLFWVISCFLLLYPVYKTFSFWSSEQILP